MAKQTFTPAQILTAAQMTSLQQTAMGGGSATAKVISYVLVAADAGTTVAMNAAGSTTITVNTSLFAAGDTVFIQNLGAGVCTVTAGTATVSTSGSLVLAQNQGGELYFTSASAAIFFQYATPASGDIEGVTAGTGISGGGTSGTVTVTNSMATAIDAKGDLIVGTGADAFSRLAVGTNTHVLTADSAEATGLKWAAAAGGVTFVGCKGYNTTNQALSNATVTKLAFNEEYFDTSAIHDKVTNNSRFTVPAGYAGKWQISITVSYEANNTGQRQLRVVKNNVTFNNIVMVAVNGDETHLSHTDIFNLSVGDYMEVAGYQSSGGSLNVTNNDYTTFAFFYLGA